MLGAHGKCCKPDRNCGLELSPRDAACRNGDMGADCFGLCDRACRVTEPALQPAAAGKQTSVLAPADPTPTFCLQLLLLLLFCVFLYQFFLFFHLLFFTFFFSTKDWFASSSKCNRPCTSRNRRGCWQQQYQLNSTRGGKNRLITNSFWYQKRCAQPAPADGESICSSQ